MRVLEFFTRKSGHPVSYCLGWIGIGVSLDGVVIRLHLSVMRNQAGSCLQLLSRRQGRRNTVQSLWRSVHLHPWCPLVLEQAHDGVSRRPWSVNVQFGVMVTQKSIYTDQCECLEFRVTAKLFREESGKMQKVALKAWSTNTCCYVQHCIYSVVRNKQCPRSQRIFSIIFNARRVCIARTMPWQCLSVRLSHAGILSKRLNISSKFHQHRVAPSF